MRDWTAVLRRVMQIAATVVVAGALVHSPLVAQSGAATKPSVERPTGIEGVVVDTAGNPVRGARLVVRDTARTGSAALLRQTGESDSLGKFRITGVPAGAHVLEVQRDEFEPAGFRFDISTGIMAEVRIKLQRDPLWAEMQRAADSILAAERVAEAQRADSIRAAAARQAPLISQGVPTQTRGGRAADRVTSQPAGGRGLLYGRVVTPEGRPVGFAQVQAMGTPLTTMTDSAGRFRFPDLNVGPYFLRARKVGYDPVVFTAQVVRNDSLDATITLTPFTSARGQRLDTIRVTADADRMSRRLRGFEERRRLGRGQFVDRQEIVLRKPQVMSDLLRGRANVTVERQSNTGQTVIYGPRLSISGGVCKLALIVDGVLIPNAQGDLDALVPVDMIAAIEVYNSGTSVPSQFARLETDCGAIIVWTR